MIYGTPATSLARGTFGTPGNRAVGAIGESLTAAVLNGFGNRAAIFHDLAVPGHSINVDHAVLADNRLLIIDSKVWAAGRYWSIGGWYFRGLERRPVPTQAVAMARESLALYLRPHRIKVVRPLVALWSGSQASRQQPWFDNDGHAVSFGGSGMATPFLHYRYPGAKAVEGNALHPWVSDFTSRADDPHRGAVAALRQLLY